MAFLPFRHQPSLAADTRRLLLCIDAIEMILAVTFNFLVIADLKRRRGNRNGQVFAILLMVLAAVNLGAALIVIPSHAVTLVYAGKHAFYVQVVFQAGAVACSQGTLCVVVLLAINRCYSNKGKSTSKGSLGNRLFRDIRHARDLVLAVCVSLLTVTLVVTSFGVWWNTEAHLALAFSILCLDAMIFITTSVLFVRSHINHHYTPKGSGYHDNDERRTCNWLTGVTMATLQLCYLPLAVIVLWHFGLLLAGTTSPAVHHHFATVACSVMTASYALLPLVYLKIYSQWNCSPLRGKVEPAVIRSNADELLFDPPLAGEATHEEELSLQPTMASIVLNR